MNIFILTIFGVDADNVFNSFDFGSDPFYQFFYAIFCFSTYFFVRFRLYISKERQFMD